MWHKKLAT
ncbi:hypothetical protein YPPY52_3488, partial [Yersinia pestis PY-52]